MSTRCTIKDARDDATGQGFHLYEDLADALHALQPAGTLPGIAAALCGALFVGEGSVEVQGCYGVSAMLQCRLSTLM